MDVADTYYFAGLALGILIGIWIGFRLFRYGLIERAKRAGKIHELNKLLDAILAAGR